MTYIFSNPFRMMAFLILACPVPLTLFTHLRYGGPLIWRWWWLSVIVAVALLIPWKALRIRWYTYRTPRGIDPTYWYSHKDKR